MTRFVGYARVSSTDQSLDIQIKALKDAGCVAIFSEKRSGTSTSKRVELAKAIASCWPGDTLVITRLDRMARSLKDMISILELLQERNVNFRCIEQPIDISTSFGRAIMQILGAFAELETSFRKERQRAGIDAAMKRGVYRRKVNHDEIKRLRYERELPKAEVAKRLHITPEWVEKVAPMSGRAEYLRAKRQLTHPPSASRPEDHGAHDAV